MSVLINRTLSVGDLNSDDQVDVDDLLQLLGVWGPCESCAEDFGSDGAVDIDDLLELLGNWDASEKAATTPR